MKNIGERIVILQEEVKFEGEKQEVLYIKYREFFEPRLKDLISRLTQNEHNELIQLEEKKMKEESEVFISSPEKLSWKSTEETEKNLKSLLDKLKRGNRIVERMIEILESAAQR
jgi:hypothetical protein